MSEIKLNEIKLIGLSLDKKTTNEGGQSTIDCGNLWQEFEKGEYFNKIHGKISNEIVAVYYDYEGDYTQPFAYFIGCKVTTDTLVPAGLKSLSIPEQSYEKYAAKGKMPDCISDAWKKIWGSANNRAYSYDFEIYDERSKDWTNAEVDIYISIK